jgi:hypothetical protein
MRLARGAELACKLRSLVACVPAFVAASASAQDVAWVKRNPPNKPGLNLAEAMAFVTVRSVCVYAGPNYIDGKRPTWKWEHAWVIDIERGVVIAAMSGLPIALELAWLELAGGEPLLVVLGARRLAVYRLLTK